MIDIVDRFIRVNDAMGPAKFDSASDKHDDCKDGKTKSEK